MTTKPQRYWVIQKVVPYSPNPAGYEYMNKRQGYEGIMFVYRTRQHAIKANGGSRVGVACYYQQ